MVKVLERPRPEWPEPPPGMVASLTIPSKRYMEDPVYYDQRGLGPFEQRRVWKIKNEVDQVEKVKEMLNDYESENHRREMLFIAAIKGHVGIVRAILETGIKVYPASEVEKPEDGPYEMGEHPSTVPLHAAAYNGHLECVKVLVEEAKVDIDKHDEMGRTPLIAAAVDGHLEIVKYLLSNGANPTLRLNSSELAKEYVKVYHGADALEMGAGTGNVELVRLLLEHPFYGSTRKRKNRPDEDGIWVTPLALLAAAGSRNVELVKLLLERGAYPTENRDEKTKGELLNEEERNAIEKAIPNAIENGDLETLKLLLSYQNPLNEDGNSLPYIMQRHINEGRYVAMIHNQPEKFRFLNSFGVEDTGESLNKLPDGMTINIPRLLELAASHNSVECAKMLIEEHGADPNYLRVPPATTPLYWAAAENKMEMVRYLLENCNIDLHIASGRFAAGPTPLYIAIHLQCTECVELLLQHGGPVNHVDKELIDIDKPTTAILANIHGNEMSIKLMTEANFQASKVECEYLVVKLGLEDKSWLKKLQIRRSNDELRENGELARELNGDEKVQDESDWRAKLIVLPTSKDREEWVLNTFRLYVRPGLIPVGEDPDQIHFLD